MHTNYRLQCNLCTGWEDKDNTLQWEQNIKNKHESSFQLHVHNYGPKSSSLFYFFFYSTPLGGEGGELNKEAFFCESQSTDLHFNRALPDTPCTGSHIPKHTHTHKGLSVSTFRLRLEDNRGEDRVKELQSSDDTTGVFSTRVALKLSQPKTESHQDIRLFASV